MGGEKPSVNMDCYLKIAGSLLRSYHNQVMDVFWLEDTDDVIQLLRYMFKKIIKPDRPLNRSKLYFETPRERVSSMNILFKMMNTVVPDSKGVLFKELVHKRLDVYKEHAFSKSHRPYWRKKIILIEKCYVVKSAYFVYEIKKFFEDAKVADLPARDAFGIGVAYGVAINTLDYLEYFSIQRSYSIYHKLGQGLIKKFSSYKYDLTYRDACRVAIAKWRGNDPCDHVEMVDYLMMKPEFSHLNRKILNKKIVKIATNHNRARGMKGFKKNDDD